MDPNVILCALALTQTISAWGGNMPPDYDERLSTCVLVAEAAIEQDVPVYIAVAVAERESGFVTGLTSKAGARGPLQIIPRYHCPNPEGEHKPHERRGVLKGCDLVKDGIRALKWFWQDYGGGDWKIALCHYNSGEKCVSKARQYAHGVLKRSGILETQFNAIALFGKDEDLN